MYDRLKTFGRGCGQLQRPPWRFSSVVFFTFTAASLGCATIGTQAPIVQDRELKRSQSEEVGEGVTAEVNATGVEIRVSASHLCNTIEQRQVERTTSTDSYNKTPAVDWFAAGVGLVLAGTGAALRIDANNVYPDDRASRTYNPSGPGRASAYGFAVLGAGVALLAIPLIDVVLASQSTVDTRQVTLKGKTLSAGGACKNRPYARGEVTARINNHAFSLGKTDETGEFAVNLERMIPDTELGFSPKSVVILVEEQEVGSVSASPLVDAMVSRVWKRLDLPRCQQPARSEDCDPVKAFVAKYPDSKQVKQARNLLAAVEPRLLQLQDEESWKAARHDDCTTTKFADPEQIKEACAGLRSYLSVFPGGAHVREAREQLRQGEARATALQARIERAQKAAEATEKASERRQCEGVCRMGCSNRRNFAICYSGCVDARCQ